FRCSLRRTWSGTSSASSPPRARSTGTRATARRPPVRAQGRRRPPRPRRSKETHMARAILRRFRESPRKVRMVANMIRGRSVDDAMSILRLQERKAAKMLTKVLGSADAAATENEKADSDKLVVTKVFIDGGPTNKRWMP